MFVTRTTCPRAAAPQAAVAPRSEPPEPRCMPMVQPTQWSALHGPQSVLWSGNLPVTAGDNHQHPESAPPLGRCGRLDEPSASMEARIRWPASYDARVLLSNGASLVQHVAIRFAGALPIIFGASVQCCVEPHTARHEHQQCWPGAWMALDVANAGETRASIACPLESLPPAHYSLLVLLNRAKVTLARVELAVKRRASRLASGTEPEPPQSADGARLAPAARAPWIARHPHRSRAQEGRVVVIESPSARPRPFPSRARCAGQAAPLTWLSATRRTVGGATAIAIARIGDAVRCCADDMAGTLCSTAVVLGGRPGVGCQQVVECHISPLPSARVNMLTNSVATFVTGRQAAGVPTLEVTAPLANSAQPARPWRLWVSFPISSRSRVQWPAVPFLYHWPGGREIEAECTGEQPPRTLGSLWTEASRDARVPLVRQVLVQRAPESEELALNATLSSERLFMVRAATIGRPLHSLFIAPAMEEGRGDPGTSGEIPLQHSSIASPPRQRQAVPGTGHQVVHSNAPLTTAKPAASTAATMQHDNSSTGSRKDKVLHCRLVFAGGCWVAVADAIALHSMRQVVSAWDSGLLATCAQRGHAVACPLPHNAVAGRRRLRFGHAFGDSIAACHVHVAASHASDTSLAFLRHAEQHVHLESWGRAALQQPAGRNDTTVTVTAQHGAIPIVAGADQAARANWTWTSAMVASRTAAHVWQQVNGTSWGGNSPEVLGLAATRPRLLPPTYMPVPPLPPTRVTDKAYPVETTCIDMCSAQLQSRDSLRFIVGCAIETSAAWCAFYVPSSPPMLRATASAACNRSASATLACTCMPPAMEGATLAALLLTEPAVSITAAPLADALCVVRVPPAPELQARAQVSNGSSFPQDGNASGGSRNDSTIPVSLPMLSSAGLSRGQPGTCWYADVANRGWWLPAGLGRRRNDLTVECRIEPARPGEYVVKFCSPPSADMACISATEATVMVEAVPTLTSASFCAPTGPLRFSLEPALSPNATLQHCRMVMEHGNEVVVAADSDGCSWPMDSAPSQPPLSLRVCWSNAGVSLCTRPHSVSVPPSETHLPVHVATSAAPRFTVPVPWRSARPLAGEATCSLRCEASTALVGRLVRGRRGGTLECELDTSAPLYGRCMASTVVPSRPCGMRWSVEMVPSQLFTQVGPALGVAGVGGVVRFLCIIPEACMRLQRLVPPVGRVTTLACAAGLSTWPAKLEGTIAVTLSCALPAHITLLASPLPIRPVLTVGVGASPTPLGPAALVHVVPLSALTTVRLQAMDAAGSIARVLSPELPAPLWLHGTVRLSTTSDQHSLRVLSMPEGIAVRIDGFRGMPLSLHAPGLAPLPVRVLANAARRSLVIWPSKLPHCAPTQVQVRGNGSEFAVGAHWTRWWCSSGNSITRAAAVEAGHVTCKVMFCAKGRHTLELWSDAGHHAAGHVWVDDSELPPLDAIAVQPSFWLPIFTETATVQVSPAGDKHFRVVDCVFFASIGAAVTQGMVESATEVQCPVPLLPATEAVSLGLRGPDGTQGKVVRLLPAQLPQTITLKPNVVWHGANTTIALLVGEDVAQAARFCCIGASDTVTATADGHQLLCTIDTSRLTCLPPASCAVSVGVSRDGHRCAYYPTTALRVVQSPQVISAKPDLLVSMAPTVIMLQGSGMSLCRQPEWHIGDGVRGRAEVLSDAAVRCHVPALQHPMLARVWLSCEGQSVQGGARLRVVSPPMATQAYTLPNQTLVVTGYGFVVDAPVLCRMHGVIRWGVVRNDTTVSCPLSYVPADDAPDCSVVELLHPRPDLQVQGTPELCASPSEPTRCTRSNAAAGSSAVQSAAGELWAIRKAGGDRFEANWLPHDALHGLLETRAQCTFAGSVGGATQVFSAPDGSKMCPFPPVSLDFAWWELAVEVSCWDMRAEAWLKVNEKVSAFKPCAPDALLSLTHALNKLFDDNDGLADQPAAMEEAPGRMIAFLPMASGEVGAKIVLINATGAALRWDEPHTLRIPLQYTGSTTESSTNSSCAVTTSTLQRASPLLVGAEPLRIVGAPFMSSFMRCHVLGLAIPVSLSWEHGAPIATCDARQVISAAVSAGATLELTVAPRAALRVAALVPRRALPLQLSAVQPGFERITLSAPYASELSQLNCSCAFQTRRDLNGPAVHRFAAVTERGVHCSVPAARDLAFQVDGGLDSLVALASPPIMVSLAVSSLLITETVWLNVSDALTMAGPPPVLVLEEGSCSTVNIALQVRHCAPDLSNRCEGRMVDDWSSIEGRLTKDNASRFTCVLNVSASPCERIDGAHIVVHAPACGSNPAGQVRLLLPRETLGVTLGAGVVILHVDPPLPSACAHHIVRCAIGGRDTAGWLENSAVVACSWPVGLGAEATHGRVAIGTRTLTYFRLPPRTVEPSARLNISHVNATAPAAASCGALWASTQLLQLTPCIVPVDGGVEIAVQGSGSGSGPCLDRLNRAQVICGVANGARYRSPGVLLVTQPNELGAWNFTVTCVSPVVQVPGLLNFSITVDSVSLFSGEQTGTSAVLRFVAPSHLLRILGTSTCTAGLPCTVCAGPVDASWALPHFHCMLGGSRADAVAVNASGMVTCHFADPPAGRHQLSLQSRGRTNQLVAAPGVHVLPPFGVHSLLPAFVPAEQPGLAVRVTGAGFQDAGRAQCRFGNWSSPAHVHSSSQLTCSVPFLEAGQLTMEWGRLEPGSEWSMARTMALPLQVSMDGQTYVDTMLKLRLHATPRVVDTSPRQLPPCLMAHGQAWLSVVGAGFANTSSLACRVGLFAHRAKFVSRQLVLCRGNAEGVVADLASGGTTLAVSLNGEHFVGNHSVPIRRTCPPGHYCGCAPIPQLCPRGSYCVGPVAANATRCPAGSYQPHRGQADCLPCPPGWVCPLEGMWEPSPCPPGYTCTEWGTAQPSLPCPAGHFCLSGTRSSAPACSRTQLVSRSTSRLLCWSNETRDMGLQLSHEPTKFWLERRRVPLLHNATFSPSRGRYCALLPCARMPELLQGERRPIPCPAGMHCPVGTPGVMTHGVAQPDEGRGTGCMPGSICADGSATPRGAGLCPPGHFCIGTQLLACPAGTSCPAEGTSLPTPCQPGTFNGMVGQTSCTPCPPGFVCPAFGTVQPLLCPAGLVCSAEGLQAPNHQCPPGFYCSLGTLTTDPFRNDTRQRPLPCPPGTYCAGGVGHADVRDGDALYAQSCAPGFFCELASTSPLGAGPCPPGFVCPKGTAVPRAVQQGQHAPHSGMQRPSQCPPGHYAPTIGSAECYACPPGVACSSEGVSVADVCPPGTYRGASLAVTHCVGCPKGTWSRNWELRHEMECQPCPPGVICAVEGMQHVCSWSDLPRNWREVPDATSMAECLALGASHTWGVPPPDAVQYVKDGAMWVTHVALEGGGEQACFTNQQPRGSIVYQRMREYFGLRVDLRPNRRGHSGYSDGRYKGYFGPGSLYTDLPVSTSIDSWVPCAPGHFEFDYEAGGEVWVPGTCEADLICDTMQASQGTPCSEGYVCPERSTFESSAASPCPWGYVCGFGVTPDRSLATPAGMYLDLCSAGFVCSEGTSVGQRQRTACPSGYFCPTGTADPLLGRMAADSLRRQLPRSLANPFYHEVHEVVLPGVKLPQLLSDHDMRCILAEVPAMRTLIVNQTMPGGTTREVPASLLHAEACGRDHVWRLVHDAQQRASCNCARQAHRVLALYRLWLCTAAPAPLQRRCVFHADPLLGVPTPGVKVADSTEPWLQLEQLQLEPMVPPHYDTVRRRVQAVFARQETELRQGSRASVDEAVYDLHWGIELVDELGAELPSWVRFEPNSNATVRLDACACHDLLRCPDGTSSDVGATSVLQCSKADNEVLARSAAVTERSEYVVQQDGALWLDLRGYDVAVLTVDLRHAPMNFTYGDHYLLSVYVDCAPCPPRYVCMNDHGGGAVDVPCASPPLAEQRERGVFCATQRDPDTGAVSAQGCCACRSRQMPYYFEHNVPVFPFEDNKHDVVQLSLTALKDSRVMVVAELLHGLYVSDFKDTFTQQWQARVFSPARAYTTAQQAKVDRSRGLQSQFLAVLLQESFAELDLFLNRPEIHHRGEAGGTGAELTLIDDVLLDRLADLWVGDPSLASSTAFPRKATVTREEVEQQIARGWSRAGVRTQNSTQGHPESQPFLAREPHLRIRDAEEWWRSADASPLFALPYLPFFSNCEGYGAHISIARLTEDHPDCQRPDIADVVHVSPYPWQGRLVPRGDSCSSDTAMRCMYEERIADPGARLRWFEAPAGMELFYLTRAPVPFELFRGQGVDEGGGERWGRTEALRSLIGTEDLIPVTGACDLIAVVARFAH